MNKRQEKPDIRYYPSEKTDRELQRSVNFADSLFWHNIESISKFISAAINKLFDLFS